MRPSFLNLFIKKLTRERVVPTISARVSWLILGIKTSALPSLPKCASNSSIRASLFSLELKSWSTKIFFIPDIPGQQIGHEHIGKRVFPVKHFHHRVLIDSHHGAIGHCGCGAQALRNRPRSECRLWLPSRSATQTWVLPFLLVYRKRHRRGRLGQRSSASWEKLRFFYRRRWLKGTSWYRICGFSWAQLQVS